MPHEVMLARLYFPLTGQGTFSGGDRLRFTIVFCSRLFPPLL
ncbi:hypothetical protein C4K22_4556 [Pseudomonas chlororaphis subsp. aurantiaca]|nr:hypothetical protein C4K22_4556 [Pseudomonas chlororaphis subsp. aurantiaca]AZD43624.1 hypothetical protein C4K21_4564 [Pseudomonas chlororaphis subsp. aurantiaca]